MKEIAKFHDVTVGLLHVPGSDVIHCRILILYPAVTNSLDIIWQVFQPELYKGVISGKKSSVG